MKLAIALTLMALAAGCRRRFDELPDGAPGADGDAADVTDGAPDADPCAFTLCESFEGGLQLGWNMLIMNGGSGGLQGGQFVVTLPATSSSMFLSLNLPVPTSTVVIGMKLGYATTDIGSDCELDLVALNWDSGACASPFGVYLVRDGTNPFNLQETNGNAGCNGNRNNYFGVLENTGLHDVRMTLTIGAVGTARAKLELDGTTIYDMLTLQPLPSAPLTLKLGGVIVRNAAATWTITYDDVYIDVQ